MKDDATLHDARLQELAQRLGAQAAERLDVERTAQAVVARLRTEPRAEIRVLGWIRPAWLRIAAVLVIALGAGAVVRSLWHHEAGTAEVATAAGAELSDLSTDQLRQLLEAVGGEPVGRGGPGEDYETVSSQDVGLEDLSALELRALLVSLGGEG